MNTPFLAQIPPNAYRFNHEDKLTNSFYWSETVDVDGVPFRCSVTAHENIWSGFGDSSDPKERLGTWFSISCDERGDRDFSCESELKSRRMRNITRRRGLSHFRMHNLSGTSSTLQEARDKLTEHCRWFLYSKRA